MAQAHYMIRKLSLSSLQPPPSAKRQKVRPPRPPRAPGARQPSDARFKPTPMPELDDASELDVTITPRRLPFDAAMGEADSTDDEAASFVLHTPNRGLPRSPEASEGPLAVQVNPFQDGFAAPAGAGAAGVCSAEAVTPPGSPFRAPVPSAAAATPDMLLLDSPPRAGAGEDSDAPPSTPAKLRVASPRRPTPAAAVTPAPSLAGGLEDSRFATDFEELGVVGTGSFGTVMKVRRRLDGCLYAVKRSRRRFHGHASRQQMLHEVFALAALCAEREVPHVVRYFSAWVEDAHLFIQTELCDCSLEDLVTRGCFPQDAAALLTAARHVLLGLGQLHAHKMVHLDIKPANIFLKHDQFKIGDFGLATLADQASHEVQEGDSRYLPRELLLEEASDLTKCDIFSLGATLYEACLGRPLPPNGPEWTEIRNGALQALPAVPDDLMQLIRDMMHPEASLRPSAEVLLRHPLLRSDEETELARSRDAAERSQALAETYKNALVEKIEKEQSKLTRSYTM